MCLSVATAVVAPADTTTTSAVVVASVPGASLVAKGSSVLAEDVAAASVAHGRLSAGVPLTVILSAACTTRYVCTELHYHCSQPKLDETVVHLIHTLQREQMKQDNVLSLSKFIIYIIYIRIIICHESLRDMEFLQ